MDTLTTAPPVDSTERAYSIPVTCEMLGGLSRGQFYAEVREGRLTARKIGSRTVVLASEIDRYLAALPVAEPAR